MDLQNLSEMIAQGFEDVDRLARNMLKVFICGSHIDGDDKDLENARDEIKNELKVPGVFLMRDIETKQKLPYNQKFDLVWTHIAKGDNVPLCIMYAGKNAGKSQGLNAEIQAVSTDPEKKASTHLIRFEGIRLVNHADEFPSYHVKGVDEFKGTAKRLVEAKVKEIASYLLRQKEGQKGRETGKVKTLINKGDIIS